MQVGTEMTKFPSVSAVLIYYAVTFGVILAVYPAYMRGSSLSAQEIEYLFFIFGASRFATLFFVPRIARYGILALAFGVAATAAGMLISFLFTTFLTFAAALALVGLATSIFYPVTFNIVTKNTPSSKMGQKLGVYETMFGIGWAVGPLVVGLSSQSFGSSTPYLALFVIGSGLAMALALAKR
jgi:MFS family permease